MTETTAEQRDELRRLHEAATPSPWEHFVHNDAPHGGEPEPCHFVRIGRPSEPFCVITGWGQDSCPGAAKDADLMAASRNALPAILADAERLAEIEAALWEEIGNAFNAAENAKSGVGAKVPLQNIFEHFAERLQRILYGGEKDD